MVVVRATQWMSNRDDRCRAVPGVGRPVGRSQVFDREMFLSRYDGDAFKLMDQMTSTQQFMTFMQSGPLAGGPDSKCAIDHLCELDIVPHDVKDLARHLEGPARKTASRRME